jgi:hypothetical protein
MPQRRAVMMRRIPRKVLNILVPGGRSAPGSPWPGEAAQDDGQRPVIIFRSIALAIAA